MNKIESGVYVNLPIDDYHNDIALGSSSIKKLISDPAEYWYSSPLNSNREIEESTPAMKFGRAYHQLILESDKFDYKIKPGVKTTKEEGMLGEGEYQQLQAMRTALMWNKKQFAILSGGVAEVSVFFDYAYNGNVFPCKARFDLFAPHWIADLKTAADISDKALRFSFADFGYDISGAIYSIAAQELKKMIAAGYKMPPEFDEQFIADFTSYPQQAFAFVFQLKSPPYSSRVWTMSPFISEIGRDKFHYGLEIYQANKDTDGPWRSRWNEIETIDESMVYYRN